ncbi:oxygenase MpaB family protein [Pontibacter anaerobius]|uniref:Oxygenase MpaB family protein n=1 Tax=Pontibacter anaerobius TaxID=2993940 RepID=A0ABT3REY7_9BACT|nr:oxygenase MpaB family protein [Pontibacter anaerobius]MCX2740399.1 oxygenase MpaB family protein [Pontibacter anaerobius]
MNYFVQQNSVVRQIWGKSDTILFIFAGASAEFALNKAVDWLYFTGRLPADPLGRLFSTVGYARKIVFSEEAAAHRAIDSMAAIHAGVESRRGYAIPDWAYRDVLFMLIDYSIRAYELLERRLTEEEKAEVFEVFNRVGTRMGIQGLPSSYPEWQLAREEHLLQNLEESKYTSDLYQQYKKNLGRVRYWLLLQAQVLVVPEHVRAQLRLWRVPVLKPVLAGYKLSRAFNAEWLLKELILPPDYKAEIRELDVVRIV